MRPCFASTTLLVQELSEARQEAGDLVQLLKSRASELAVTLDADFPDMRSSIWLSEAAAQSSVQSLSPQMTENRKRVSDAKLTRFASLV